MAINKTSRKESIVLGADSLNNVFTVPFEAENTSEVSVYDKDGNLTIEGINYNITNNTIPGVSSNTITVTWVGVAAAGTYTFYRTSPRTQTLDIRFGFESGDIESVFDRLTLAAQNALKTSNNALGASSERIQEVGEPIDDTDASTVRYAQEAYSKSGNLCPGVSGTDDAKALYSQSTSSVIWKDPFDVTAPSANTKILQVNGLGVPAWVDPVEYAPTYPTTEPMYLSVSSEAQAWRSVNQLPSLAKGSVGDTLVYQEGNTVAWETIRWLEYVPTTHKHLWNSTGTGASGAVGAATATLYAAAKCAAIWENDTDKNTGGDPLNYVKGKTGQARICFIEWDLSSLTAANYTMDTIVSCYLKIYFTARGSVTDKNFIIKRVKNTFVEGTGASGNSYNDDGLTREKPSTGSPDWLWGGGNFDPARELDQELPVPTFIVGSSTTTGAFTYIDVTPLFLDALKNRSGVLRIAMYDPNPNSTNTWARFRSNGGHSDDLKLEVTLANERKAYWQKWSYYHQSVSSMSDTDVEIDYGITNPHVTFSLNQIASDAQLEHVVKGSHFGATGSTVACTYTHSHDTTSNDNPGTITNGLTAFGFLTSGNGMDIPGMFTEWTQDNYNSFYGDLTGRTSIVWLEDE